MNELICQTKYPPICFSSQIANVRQMYYSYGMHHYDELLLVVSCIHDNNYKNNNNYCVCKVLSANIRSLQMDFHFLHHYTCADFSILVDLVYLANVLCKHLSLWHLIVHVTFANIQQGMVGTIPVQSSCTLTEQTSKVHQIMR